MKKRYRIVEINSHDAYYRDREFMIGRTGMAEIPKRGCVFFEFDEPAWVGVEEYRDANFLPAVVLEEVVDDPETLLQMAQYNEYDQEDD